MTFVVLQLTLTAVLGAAPQSWVAETDAKVIDDFIARQSRSERGVEYKEARKVLTGDVNRDALPDIVVLYTIEGQGGSNNYVQYLVVFVRSRDKLVPLTHASVGGKSYRAVELQGIRDNQIYLDTLDYLRTDPACCPSKKGTTHYRIINRKLKEESATNNF